MNLGKIIRSSYKKVTHVIFDLDGTLINSDELAVKMCQKIISRYGKSLTFPQKSQILRVQSMETIAFIIKEHNLPLTLDEFYQNVKIGFSKLSGDSYKLKPGVERLVKHLYNSKVPLAIATNSPKDFCAISTKHHTQIMSCFHHIVSAPSEPEVEKDKPAPDAFLVCARRFEDSPSPEEVLVIEDSTTGVEAAVAAGMQVVAVPNPLVDAKCFKDATLVLETLESFEPELFGLPSFPNDRVVKQSVVGSEHQTEKRRFHCSPSSLRYINMPFYDPVTHVIFDLDGTILDIEREIIKIFQSMAEKRGKQITLPQLVHCFELQGSDMLAFIIGELDLSLSVKEFYNEIVNKLKRSKIQIKPGVERLVKHLHDKNVPIAIATNSPKERFDITTRDHQDLISHFHHWVAGKSEPEVEGDKPVPDVFLLCARRFDDCPSPKKVLVIEDSPCGVEAAVAAGMQVVMVPDPLVDPKHLKKATVVLDTLESFQPELFGLPPFPN